MSEAKTPQEIIESIMALLPSNLTEDEKRATASEINQFAVLLIRMEAGYEESSGIHESFIR